MVDIDKILHHPGYNSQHSKRNKNDYYYEGVDLSTIGFCGPNF